MIIITDLLIPRSLDEALELMDKYSPDIKPIAGGTELLILIRDGKIPRPKYLLDLNPLRSELSYVVVDENSVRIGALTTVFELSKTILHRDYRFAGFSDLWNKFGTLVIRISATIGGNVASATQYSDYIPLLLVYDSVVKTISVKGERCFKLEEFIVDTRKTMLESNEIIKEIEFKVPPPRASSSFIKFDRRNILIAGVITGAFYLEIDDGLIKNVRIAYDMIREKRIPGRARETEKALVNKEFSEELVEKTGYNVLSREMIRISDWWTTAEYRLEMSIVALKHGLKTAYERIKRGFI
ncbi:MAG: FAD binding domain-containing protein [Desulfurococcaceae archaeon]